MPPINFRKKITEAILSGDVTHAIELIDELDPEILQINYEITFLLKQHHLIHLIQKVSFHAILKINNDKLI